MPSRYFFFRRRPLYLYGLQFIAIIAYILWAIDNKYETILRIYLVYIYISLALGFLFAFLFLAITKPKRYNVHDMKNGKQLPLLAFLSEYLSYPFLIFGAVLYFTCIKDFSLSGQDDLWIGLSSLFLTIYTPVQLLIDLHVERQIRYCAE